MRRLIFITQQLDPAHPVLAGTIAKIRALARRVDEVVVLADRVLPGALPGNSRSASFGSRAKAGRGVRFETALARELARRPRPVGIVAHMCPIYSVLAAPVARPLGVPVVLWYTQWRVSRVLRLAERFSNAVISVDRRSFPIDSPKVTAIGHGIDVDEFPCQPSDGGAKGFRALCLGRYSVAKGLETMIRAVRLAVDAGLEVRLDAHGPTLSEAERAHRVELDHLVDELGLERQVRLGEAVLRADVPNRLMEASCLINNMEAGSPDKVVYEAAASCRPVLASNPVFDELFAGLPVQLDFGREDSLELAERLQTLAALSAEERMELGRALRERVIARHSVATWADGVMRVVGSLSS